MPSLTSVRARLLAGLLTIIATVGIGIVVTDDPGPTPGSHHRTVTVTLGRAAKAAVPDRQLEVPAAAVAAAATPTAVDHAQGARDETPAGVEPSVLEAGRQAQETAAATDQLPISAPDAAPVQAGCRSRFLNVNWSSRRGVAPKIIVLHYTVSPNLLGWSDVDGVTAFFDRNATQASSNYVEDGEGHCNYIVREVDKAWAQAGFNPWAISIEVINTGREPRYIAPAGLRQLARIVHDAAKRWGIPLRAGAVSGCTVARSGVVTHQMLGACGGGHVDISPYGNAARDQVIAAARALGPKPITAVDRRTCRRLNAWRRAGRPSSQAATNVARRQALAHRHLTCTAAGPVRS